MTKLALEIGPGAHPAKQDGDGYEWLRVEYPGKSGPELFYDKSLFIARWGLDSLPFQNDRFDLVYAAHVLEHVSWTNTQAALKEVFRVLKPGGGVEIWVPDFQYLVECYLQRKCGDDWRHENPTGDAMTWLNGRLFTYGPEPNFHKACFDSKSLARHLLDAGFTNPLRIDGLEAERGHKHGAISLGVRAYK